MPFQEAILEGAKHALDKSIVVTHRRAGVRGLDLQLKQHREDGTRLEGRTVIAMQRGLVSHCTNILGQRCALYEMRGLLGVVGEVYFETYILADEDVQN